MTMDVRHQIVELLPRLRRFGYALTGSMDDADDLVQTACVRALGNLDAYEAGTRLDSWMFRIMQNAFIDRRRQTVRRQTDSDSEAMEAQPFDARIFEQAAARADLAVVRRAVAELPEEQRAVLALVAIDGQSYQEAADLLGVPIGTVMSRLSRARRKLAEAVALGSSGPERTGTP